ncbi:MAG: pyruvate ferredoxin oxidoreductase [bacterium]|nr:pyruvate ferredoxin oxidoreductase [bacterium]
MKAIEKTQPRSGIDDIKNVLIVGVGGQGVIIVSKVLARICQLQGYSVKQSEVHGMAKRGGSVFSHVRYGSRVWSPTIPRGKSDILVALEWAEGLRWLNHLNKKTGTLIADTQHIVPPFACLDRKRGAESAYRTRLPDEILENLHDGYALDATAIATKIGNYRVSNTVLLGTLAAILDFPVELWRKVIGEMVPPKTIDLNLEAFEAGRQWVEQSQKEGKAPKQDPVLIPHVISHPDEEEFELILTPEWCKGCDICVKVCPERCLILNAEQKVELADADACTGCRICEWLCPDFAIDVKRTNKLGAGA